MKAINIPKPSSQPRARSSYGAVAIPMIILIMAAKNKILSIQSLDTYHIILHHDFNLIFSL